MPKPTLFVAAAALSVLPSVAWSDGLKVEPGLWEFTTTTPGAAGSPPGASTSTECIRDDDMTPQKFTSKMKGCQISEPKADASSMSWKMNCPSPHGSMTGTGSFTSTGTTVAGSLDMTMDVGGQKFPMGSKWTGRRTGECK